jgi:hypothetical protein
MMTSSIPTIALPTLEQSPQAQFERFVEFLGYQPGDEVCFRMLPPKGLDKVAEPWKVFPQFYYWDKKRKEHIPSSKKLVMRGDRLYWVTHHGERLVSSVPFAWLTKQNGLGFGVYVVVNPGGHSKKEITEQRAIFWESDDKSKAAQLEQYDGFTASLGGGGMGIETKSSVHNYVPLSQAIDPAEGEILQKRLIAHHDSDKSIWNADRLMRPPGFDHTSVNPESQEIERVPVRIVREWDGKFADNDAVDALLPELPEEEKAAIRASGVRREYVPVAASTHPGDPRNFIRLLPYCQDKGNGWATAQIPGASSTNGFQVNLETGGWNCFTGSYSDRQEAFNAVLEYCNTQDPNVSLDAYWDWFNENPGLRAALTLVDSGKSEVNSDDPVVLRDRQNLKRRMKAQTLRHTWGDDWKISPEKHPNVVSYPGGEHIPALDLSGGDYEKPVFYEFSQPMESVARGQKTIAIRGGLGSGKTHRIIANVIPLAKTRQIIMVASRNGLLRQTAARIEAAHPGIPVYHYQDDVAKYKEFLRTGETGVFLMCPESFKEYSTGEVEAEKLQDVILVVDEFRSIRKSIWKSLKSKAEFERLLKHCGLVVVADAHLSDICMNRLKQSGRSPESTVLYWQEPTKYQKNVIFLEQRTREGAVSNNHEGLALEMGLQLAAKGKLAIATDSKKAGYALERKLTEAGYKVAFVCADDPEFAHEVLASPDSTLKDCDVFIYTPTAESGLDVQLPFENVLLVACGVLEPLTLLQMVGRCRQAKNIYIDCPRRNGTDGFIRDLSDKQIERMHQKYKTAMERHGLGYGKTGHTAWGWTEKEIFAPIYRTYGYEVLRLVCEEVFESVETLEVNHDRCSEWREVSARVRLDLTAETHNADLERGQEMLADDQKAPPTRADVFALNLAKVMRDRRGLIEFYREEFLKLNALDDPAKKEELLTILYEIGKGRSDKLSLFYLARTGTDRDFELMWQNIQTQERVNPLGVTVDDYRMCLFFRRLGLNELIQLMQRSALVGGGGVQDLNIFTWRSSAIAERFNLFLKDAELRDWFPQVTHSAALFQQIKVVMSRMGVQSATARQRDSEGKSAGDAPRAYFTGWVVLGASGNKVFKSLLGDLVPAMHQWVRDRLLAMRDAVVRRLGERMSDPNLPQDDLVRFLVQIAELQDYEPFGGLPPDPEGFLKHGDDLDDMEAAA